MVLLIKIFLSILLVVCLFNMPYGYYQFVRFSAMIVFVLLAYFSYEQNKNSEVIIYIGLALLFQPFIKVALGRSVWNIVDVIIAVTLIGSLLLKTNK